VRFKCIHIHHNSCLSIDTDFTALGPGYGTWNVVSAIEK
jgi:hypothetical protein